MKKWVYLLLILFVLTKINLVFKYHDTRWDESVYIGMGKYIFSSGEIGLWEPIRPIGLPLIMGFFWKIGLSPVIMSEIISILFAAANIYLTYLIGKKLFDETVGLISAVILSLTPFFYYFSSYGFSGIPSTFFALLGLYFFIEDKYFITGIFSGISFLFRFPQGLLLIVFSSLIFFKNKKRLFNFVTGWFIAVLPFLIFNLFMYKDMFLPFLQAVSHQSNPVHSVVNNTFFSRIYNVSYYIVEIFKQAPIIILAIFYYKENKKTLLPFLLFLVYFTYIINKQLRFALIFIPYLCIMAAYGTNTLLLKKQKLAFLIILIILSIPPLMLVYNQYRWRSNYIPKIQSLNNFFEDKAGIILTTYPTSVAYSDNKFIPFYNNVDDAVEIFEKENTNADYILYSKLFYPCYDDECLEKRQNLFDKISQNKLIFNLSYDQNYYVYEI